jgi:hypothetical protein
MVENVVAFFYPDDFDSATRALQLLDGLSTRSRDVILTNMRQSVSLTLQILNSIYPRANLDEAGEGFAATCTEDEANKLVEDSAMTVRQIVEMLPVNMS